MNNLKQLLGEEWYEILKDEFTKDYMKDLVATINKQAENNVIYPAKGETFNAYKYTPYSKVRVCIIGQDPYINEGEAHGLAFSTFSGKSTPSLRKIEQAVKAINPNTSWSNNLERWAHQGVFLLNRVLTVNAGRSNSHKGIGWEHFTSKTVRELDKKGIIFLLWGRDAETVGQYITKSTVITCEHPVAASYKGRDWNNENCFNKVNEMLKDKIDW